VAAWKIKENRALESGCAVTLEYEGRELAVHVAAGRNLDSVVDEYGQRLVTIVEDTKKEENHQVEVVADVSASESKPCGCAGKSKTLGLLSLGKALLGGRASPEVAARRLAICRACQATDPTGSRLYRMIAGKAYCGVPRLSELGKVYRDEKLWGCGCELGWKSSMVESECPRSRW